MYVTANAKDFEVIKKVHGGLGQSPEKLKYFSLQIAQMEMSTLRKSETLFQIKNFFSIVTCFLE